MRQADDVTKSRADSEFLTMLGQGNGVLIVTVTTAGPMSDKTPYLNNGLRISEQGAVLTEGGDAASR